MDVLAQLNDEPKQLAACCLAISKPLLQKVLSFLPRGPDLVLSVGCGSGLLESLLLRCSNDQLSLFGVEVPSCNCPFLPEDRILRVPDTRSLHPDAILASVLLFVYPRVPALVASYVDVAAGGALQMLVWLGHRSDWSDGEDAIYKSFHDVEIVRDANLPEHDIMVVARDPKKMVSKD